MTPYLVDTFWKNEKRKPPIREAVPSEVTKNWVDSTVVDFYVRRSIVRIVAERDADKSQAGGARAAQDAHCHSCGFGKLKLVPLEFNPSQQLLQAGNFGGTYPLARIVAAEDADVPRADGAPDTH